VNNLEIYFDVARDVLVNAGVAVHNREFNSGVPFSEKLLIVAPERICSYDETRVELDCTNPCKDESDCIIGDGVKDDGTSIVTKSSKSPTAVCGHLGDSGFLPVYIVFNSGDSFEPH
jgi:hypothetical protein